MYEAARRLTDLCRDRVGDSLRMVLLYSEGGSQRVVYIREDLEGAYGPEDINAVGVTAYELHDDIRRVGAEKVDADRHLGTVHVYDGFVAVQVAAEVDRGAIVSFDPGVTSRLHGFVETCRDVLVS